MEMFLMVATMSLIGLVVCLGMFATAMRDDHAAPDVRPDRALPLAPPRFFVEDRTPPPPPAPSPRVPIEVLLLQIERHVRLEQAAAESFLDSPTAKSLHSRTTSPLVH